MNLAEKLREATSETGPPHLVIEARAGTGKTTTLVEGLRRVKRMESKLTPSPQQKLIWEEMEKSADAKTICFVAFNKSIADELKRRVPTGCEAMTMHSLGNKAVMRAFGRVEINQYRVEDILCELMGGCDPRELRRKEPELISAVKELVGLCKQNLTNVENDDELDELAAHYDVEINSSRAKIYHLVRKVLVRCKDVTLSRAIDFDDMIWLPVVLGLPLPKYDLLLVDEAQDLNRCQQELCLRCGKRIIVCGDPKQAIYGFAGADSRSMPRMQEILETNTRGCLLLPLTVTRRCGKMIVKEANTFVPEFEAFETNPEGAVTRIKYTATSDKSDKDYRVRVKDGDMILCRVNAPLVSECFKFLKEGRRANIQGRNIGQGLIKMINKLEKQSRSSSYRIEEFISDLDDWKASEIKKETVKRFPSEAKIISIVDKCECLLCFAEAAKTVQEVREKIDSIFTDNPDIVGIRLSSVHKAKGLEASNVFILLPKGGGMPHPMAKTAWQLEQEHNLKYVAITRAINSLTWVAE